MVKVIIERFIAADMESTYDAWIKDTLKATLEAPGYISGANFTDVQDSAHRVLITNWRSLEAWKQWRSSTERQAVVDRFQPIFSQPEKITVLSA